MTGAAANSMFTRRQVLRGALAAGASLSAGGLLAGCAGAGAGASAALPSGPPRRGGRLRVGVSGGSAKDRLDVHMSSTHADVLRAFNLFEALAIRSPDFSELQMLLAESIQPEGNRPDVWTVRLKDGVQFHHGKTVTADDVIFTLRRILDPKDPKRGASTIGYVDVDGLRKLDARTVRIPLQFPNVGFPDDLCQFFVGIVPTDFDPQRPVGTGPFTLASFSPGERTVLSRFDNYRETGRPYVDELVVVNFADDTARTDALLGGQVEAMEFLPSSLIEAIRENAGLRVLIAESGAWLPLVMRIDVPPFVDVRVRQAFRLIADREQMIEQVLSGQGRVANDLYAPYDTVYARDIPQRHQDLEQARWLLRQAGHESLTVELATNGTMGTAEEAQVFAQQAAGAGVTVNVRKVDAATYSKNYLQWPFAGDFWSTRNYLSQVAQGELPGSPFNETHWSDPAFEKLIRQGRSELDRNRRAEILHETQLMQHDRSGYVIPYFSNTVDAYSAKVGGFTPSRSGWSFGDYSFKNVGFLGEET